MDYYTNLKKSVDKYQKKGLMYRADGNQLKLDCIENFLISVNNPKTTKDDAKKILKNESANDMQKMNKTNSRSQMNEKKLCLMFISMLLVCLLFF